MLEVQALFDAMEIILCVGVLILATHQLPRQPMCNCQKQQAMTRQKVAGTHVVREARFPKVDSEGPGYVLLKVAEV